MKYLSFLFLWLIPMLGMVGCQKYLTNEPSDFVTPEANYASKKQLLNALGGVYDVLGQNRSQLYANEFFSSLNASNDLSFYGRSAQSTGPEVYNFDNTDPVMNNTWNALYTGIERANNLIFYIDEAESVSQEDKDAILGETKFLRGYYYYFLVSNFGDVPLRLEPTTQTGAKSVNIPRTPAAEVYEQVIEDLEEAEQLVYPADHFEDASRVNQSVVQGILSRVYLSMAGTPMKVSGAYEKARDWAKKVMDSGIHSLNPDFKQIFIDELQGNYDDVHKGVLWEAQFLGNAEGIHQEEGRMGNTNGIAFSNVAKQADSGYSYGFIYTTRKLYELYKDNDLRRDWTIATYRYDNGGDRIYFANDFAYDRNMGKWRRTYETLLPKNKNFSGTNYPILRYADVLLMFAEAENQINNGPTSAAYEAVNQVRRRGYGLSVDQADAAVDISGLDENAFQREIQDERARELAFEGFRRADLIRWGIWKQTMLEASVRMKQDLDNNASWKYASLGASNAASSDRYLLFPIPSSETSVNKAIVQNPGY